MYAYKLEPDNSNWVSSGGRSDIYYYHEQGR